MLMKKILVGTDFSGSSSRALDFAVDIAEKIDASITVLNVVYPLASKAPVKVEPPVKQTETSAVDWKKYNEKTLLKLINKTKKRKPNLEISSLIREGQPVPQILDASKDFDIIVLGQRGRTMPNSHIGNITEKVAALAHRPVVIVP
jgi:nucleotide-binding universal stress UspA family protein